jgi:hypothetical protein
VKFRYLPELKFALDDVVAHELRINEIIAGMRGSDATGDEPPGD